MLKSTSISPVQAVFGADETKPDLKATQRLRSGDKSSTAIVVEKRPLMRDLISQCLTRMGGFDVAAVATIEECLEFAGANDAIIVLISVAGSPNTEHNQQIVQRATQGLAGIPIVVLSDVEDLHQVMSVLQLGTRGYISTGMSLDVAIEALWLVRAAANVPASA
jgi:DNA-binding NarL/FixJ family response regulator